MTVANPENWYTFWYTHLDTQRLSKSVTLLKQEMNRLHRKRKSFFSNTLFVIRIYWNQSPISLLVECFLDAAKKVLVVLLSVWLLEELTALIMLNASFLEAIRPVLIVTTITIVIDVLSHFYSNCIKPNNDLSVRTVLEKQLSSHAGELPLSDFDDSELYTTLEKARDSIDAVELVYNEIVQSVGNAIALFCAIKVAVDISPLLLSFLVFSVPMIIIGKKHGTFRAERDLQLERDKRKKEYARNLYYSKNFVREFKTTNAYTIPNQHYRSASKSIQTTNTSYGKKLFIWHLLGNGFSITYISILCFLFGILGYAFLPNFDTSSFSVLFLAVININSKLRKLYTAYETICGANEWFEALHAFMTYEPEPKMESKLEPGVFESLVFQNVWFSYDKKEWVLKDVSFEIHAGDRISIVGFNGSGKTTILKLLLRLYDVDKGEILLNGVNIQDYSLSSYRAVFSTVFQDCEVYAVSLLENISLYPSSNIDRSSVDTALRAVGLSRLIGEEDQVIGREFSDDGIVLSKGQQQRVAIARSLLRDCDVVVLDEPSSAIDAISSEELLKMMYKHTAGKTLIMVSHDMSFSKLATKVLLFSSGTLVESGTHSELINYNGVYAQFFSNQSKAFLSPNQ